MKNIGGVGLLQNTQNIFSIPGISLQRFADAVNDGGNFFVHEMVSLSLYKGITPVSIKSVL
jgi:hypothetical protein